MGDRTVFQGTSQGPTH